MLGRMQSFSRHFFSLTWPDGDKARMIGFACAIARKKLGFFPKKISLAVLTLPGSTFWIFLRSPFHILAHGKKVGWKEASSFIFLYARNWCWRELSRNPYWPYHSSPWKGVHVKWNGNNDSVTSKLNSSLVPYLCGGPSDLRTERIKTLPIF